MTYDHLQLLQYYGGMLVIAIALIAIGFALGFASRNRKIAFLCEANEYVLTRLTAEVATSRQLSHAISLLRKPAKRSPSNADV